MINGNYNKCAPFKNALFLVLCFFFISCGGVIGSIKKYELNTTKAQLDVSIDKLLVQNPNLVAKVDSLYNISGTGFEHSIKYLLVKDAGVEYALSYAILGDSTTWEASKTATISLISGNKYGGVLKLPKNLGVSERIKFSELFEHHFIKRLGHDYKKLD